jgi:hypothetical protein
MYLVGMIALDTIPQLLTAIGALGTAAFGLVDATKAFAGGVNHIGFKRISATVAALVPAAQPDILAILQANWFSGADLAGQKALAKSLIELNLPPLDTRTDLIVTATLDEAYQRADQLYRDGTRAWAMAVSILLALIAGHQLHAPVATSLLAGLLATPLAPIAKDLSTALATAVNTLK